MSGDILQWIVIGLLCVLVIFAAIGLLWADKEDDRILSTTTAIAYSQLPGLDVDAPNIYSDTLPIAEAQNRCTADPSCAGFVNAFGDQNYYKASVSKTVPPQENSNSVLFSKQTLCPAYPHRF